jgi:hypothetical protein
MSSQLPYRSLPRQTDSKNAPLLTDLFLPERVLTQTQIGQILRPYGIPIETRQSISTMLNKFQNAIEAVSETLTSLTIEYTKEAGASSIVKTANGFGNTVRVSAKKTNTSRDLPVQSLHSEILTSSQRLSLTAKLYTQLEHINELYEQFQNIEGREILLEFLNILPDEVKDALKDELLTDAYDIYFGRPSITRNSLKSLLTERNDEYNLTLFRRLCVEQEENLEKFLTVLYKATFPKDDFSKDHWRTILYCLIYETTYDNNNQILRRIAGGSIQIDTDDDGTCRARTSDVQTSADSSHQTPCLADLAAGFFAIYKQTGLDIGLLKTFLNDDSLGTIHVEELLYDLNKPENVRWISSFLSSEQPDVTKINLDLFKRASSIFFKLHSGKIDQSIIKDPTACFLVDTLQTLGSLIAEGQTEFKITLKTLVTFSSGAKALQHLQAAAVYAEPLFSLITSTPKAGSLKKFIDNSSPLTISPQTLKQFLSFTASVYKLGEAFEDSQKLLLDFSLGEDFQIRCSKINELLGICSQHITTDPQASSLVECILGIDTNNQAVYLGAQKILRDSVSAQGETDYVNLCSAFHSAIRQFSQPEIPKREKRQTQELSDQYKDIFDQSVHTVIVSLLNRGETKLVEALSKDAVAIKQSNIKENASPFFNVLIKNTQLLKDYEKSIAYRKAPEGAYTDFCVALFVYFEESPKAATNPRGVMSTVLSKL